MSFTISKLPDRIHRIDERGLRPLSGGERISEAELDLTLTSTGQGWRIAVRSHTPLHGLHLRWRVQPAPDSRFLGECWGRNDNQMGWHSLDPNRVMPWCFHVLDASGCTGIGVRTDVACMASWQVDNEGVSLFLDTRNGGSGVELGERELVMAELVQRDPVVGETPFQAARAFAQALAHCTPRARGECFYGGNNWYYAYGDISAESCLADARRIAEWTDGLPQQAIMLIDDGWQVAHCDNRYNAGPWHAGNRRFPDLARLAADMAATGVRPGIWYRPLVSLEGRLEPHQIQHRLPPAYARGGFSLDPTVPEVVLQLQEDARRLVDWGFTVIKHDFTSVDLLGSWLGRESGVVQPGRAWHFHDRSRTNAEIVRDLYRTITDAAGPQARILGCQTFGHLGVGSIDIQRTGGDVSGREWERTRAMGPNALAFHLAQHDVFWQVDADCAPVTPTVPWARLREWGELLAQSGTPLFVSADPRSLGPDQIAAIRSWLATAAARPQPAEPLDWLHNPCPDRWRTAAGERCFAWAAEVGCTPPGLIAGDPAALLGL